MLTSLENHCLLIPKNRSLCFTSSNMKEGIQCCKVHTLPTTLHSNSSHIFTQSHLLEELHSTLWKSHVNASEGMLHSHMRNCTKSQTSKFTVLRGWNPVGSLMRQLLYPELETSYQSAQIGMRSSLHSFLPSDVCRQEGCKIAGFGIFTDRCCAGGHSWHLAYKGAPWCQSISWLQNP